MMMLLSEIAADADGGISGTVVIGIIGAITTLVVGVIGKLKVDQVKSETRDVTLKKPVPTIQTREEPQWATQPDLEDHIERTDRHFAEVWKRFESDRNVARESANNLHKRLDKQSEATAGVQASLNEVKETTRTLLDLALHGAQPRKPGNGRQ